MSRPRSIHPLSDIALFAILLAGVVAIFYLLNTPLLEPFDRGYSEEEPQIMFDVTPMSHREERDH